MIKLNRIYNSLKEEYYNELCLIEVSISEYENDTEILSYQTEMDELEHKISDIGNVLAWLN